MPLSVLSGVTPAFNNYSVRSLGWPTGNTSVIVPYSYKGTPFPSGVHRDTVPLWNALLDQLTGQLGVKLMTPGCWGYNNRPIRSGGSPSFHSAGLALDVNAPANPYSASGRTSAHSIPDSANALARSLGMEWGGAWSSPKDYMHFEVHLSPAQVKTVAGRLVSTPEDDVQLPDLQLNDGTPHTPRGIYHWAVGSAQLLLNARGLGLPALTVDGVYGQKTADAVKALQKRWNLPQTGNIDAKTWPWVIWNEAPDFVA